VGVGRLKQEQALEMMDDSMFRTEERMPRALICGLKAVVVSTGETVVNVIVVKTVVRV